MHFSCFWKRNFRSNKLELYDVQQRKLSWFRSYLSNRKQLCRVNGVDSNVREIEIGVPQGSCLGPLLFPIYINNLQRAIQDSSVTMYADDTSLCHQSHDLTQLNEAINSDSSRQRSQEIGDLVARQ